LYFRRGGVENPGCSGCESEKGSPFMSVTMQQVRETLDQGLAKTRVRGIVREPVMVTLPLATLAANVIYASPGGA
jgi:hypothetical protein